MKHKVDNAIIMAAGMATRFGAISLRCPKALLEVKGEILIERQIRQLIEAGVPKIIIVVGYMKEQFEYLQDKFGVILVENPDYAIRNNHSSIYAAREYLKNSYICSADNYFLENPFCTQENESFYASVYIAGKTNEWCIKTDEKDYIENVTMGGRDAWIMMGHVFWTAQFSEKFQEILERDYNKEVIKGKLWESVYLDNISELKLKIKKYGPSVIFEFDSLEDLKEFEKKWE